MDAFLDYLWLKILVIVHHIKLFLDLIFSPLNSVGPGFAIFVIVCITFAMARFFSRYKTKRLVKLEKEFVYWYNLRQEAIKCCDDYEKGKLLAKNVDQARLNRVYYDYFFERFMVTLITKYLPIFSMLAYVNEAYKPDNLLKMVGRTYIYKFGKYHGKPIEAGAVFIFFVAYLVVSVGWFLIKFIYSRVRAKEAEPKSESQGTATNE